MSKYTKTTTCLIVKYFKYMMMIKICLLKVDILVCKCDKVKQQRTLSNKSSRVSAYHKVHTHKIIKCLNRKCLFVLCPDKISYTCLKLKYFEFVIALLIIMNCIFMVMKTN